MRRGGPPRRRIAPLARSPKAGGAGARSRVRGLAPARVHRDRKNDKIVFVSRRTTLAGFHFNPPLPRVLALNPHFSPHRWGFGCADYTSPRTCSGDAFPSLGARPLAPSETPPRSPPRGKRGGFRRQPRSETATEPNRKTRTARRSENAVNLDELHENGAAASRQLRRKNFDFEPRKITQRKTARENFSVSATAVIFRSAGESGRV